ncbi:hypothetical protein EF847_02560 [Actinobacteria bacterium YIM 96077]|uniref:DUF695 domain-containing protein n=2 Tax=Phytoactinopolyspora halophila TaxID=1981511 RepID=A0A329QZF9_9ACTN|nr:hypothetical protein EF847_02560 [Actinobacteria bacterium YIM 96077]RAW17794.1 hypothetical protein DPM12_02715 [Phytoactinopolyspora halophila]
MSRATDPRPAIAAFWSWWGAHRQEIVEALEENRTEAALRLVEPAIAAIDSRLSCEFTASRDKKFGLLVTSAGVPELRATAARWCLAAPDDADVEFISTRWRHPETLESSVVKVDDFDFALNELVAAARVDTNSGKVHVAVHHPLFTLVDHDHRLRVAFLGLDAAVGEIDVERWIGSVEVTVDSPVDAMPLASLGSVVDQLGGSGGEWAAMEGRSPKGPVFAIVRRAVSRYTHPLADTHVAVVLGYEDSGNGMPADPSITHEIEELEGHIVDAFGGEGPQVVHVGHITGGSQVVAHFYVDGLEIDPDVAKPVLEKWSRGKTSIARSYDPRWEHVAPFMG